jgi:hypothetical protein
MYFCISSESCFLDRGLIIVELQQYLMRPCVLQISAKYDVELKNVTIGPYPAVSGEDFTFIVPAITSKYSL